MQQDIALLPFSQTCDQINPCEWSSSNFACAMKGSLLARKNDKRERLVDAAADLFWTQGFDATSLADIAVTANVPLGNVYYYFKSKIELARSVADLFVEQSEMLIASLNDDSASASHKLQRFIDVLEGSNAARTSRGCPIARAFADFRHHDEMASKRAGEALSLLIAWAETTLEEAGREDARRRSRRLISLWQGGIVLAHAFGDSAHLEEAITAMRHEVQDGP